LLAQKVVSKVAAPKWDKNKVKRWMETNARQHVDRFTGEVNYTSLAEEAAQEFDIYEGDEIPEELFELSGKVGEDWEKKNKKASSEALVLRVAAAAKKKKSPKKSPDTGGLKLKPALIDVGNTERKALVYLRDRLSDALSGVKSLSASISEKVQDRKDDGVEIEDEVYYPDYSTCDDLCDYAKSGLEYLANTLEENQKVTEEEELAQAVGSFAKLFGKSPSPREDTKAVAKTLDLLSSAIELVPTDLAKVSSLNKLRDCFELLAKAVNTLTDSNIKAPKIPNALDPEDPRQMKLFASEQAKLRHLVRLANFKYSTLNDLDTLQGLLEMEVESSDGNRSEASLNEEIKRAAREYDNQVESVLLDWLKDNLDKIALGQGPLRTAKDADDVLEVMTSLGGGAGYLYYMEAEGNGVGTWDGDWDPLFNDRATIKELSRLVKQKTQGQYRKFKNSLEERVFELESDEG
jgi:hypothetical protein